MMRVMRLGLFTMILIGALSVPDAASGQTVPPADQVLRDAQAEVERLKTELAAMREQYDARLAALEARLTALAGQVAVAPPPAPAPVSVAPVSSGKVFNPDIAVIGNSLGAAGRNPNSDQPTFGLEEVETSFQAIVDPYARADVFLSAGPGGLEIEEGFVTFNTLPGQFLLKAGKMRAQFGKVNAMHTHALPWTDRPLVTGNLVGGDEGISESGLSVSRLLNNPFMFLEATGEAYYGASDVFESGQRSKLVYVGRLRGYRDLTEGTNIDLGGSFAYGPSRVEPSVLLGSGDMATRLMGFDATFRYRPLRRAIYRRFVARSEFIWSQPREGGVAGDTSFGLYASGDYQFARRWYAGLRYDRSARAFDASTVDKGGSFYLTYWPSEFSQVRGQYRHTSYGDNVHANEFLFQFLFSIGAHGAHVF
ncbi:MAG TPA: hypothetical protein PLH72_00905 [Vicinamibacterales bacterium]|nr:hypothetical protein [Vicinamibacterales bacterium]